MVTSLSPRFTESFKTALAMVVTYAIALQMAFDNPYWAAFAVAMVSLDTAGQSLNKAALRMGGTLLAVCVAWALLALFPQQRWAMLLALTPWLGLCAYMLMGPRRQYFWFVAGFVCLIIVVKSGGESQDPFGIAVARVEETGLGILVYSIVSLFLWPRNSRSDLEAATRELFDSQRGIWGGYRGLLGGEGSDEALRPARLREAQALTRLGQALNAAEMDTYRVWEARFAWRRWVAASTQLLETLERWRTTFPEARGLALTRLLPGLEGAYAELDRRLDQIDRLLSGAKGVEAPREVSLPVDEAGASALSHFEKGTLALFRAQVRNLDSATRSLHEAASDIHGTGALATRPRPRPSAAHFTLDLDRLRGAVTATATLWAAFLVWVYLDPSTHTMFVFFATQWTLISLLGRQSIPSMLPGLLLGFAAGGVAYVLLMPHLSGYLELGGMIFAATFGGFYLLWDPRHRGTRTAFLALFFATIAVSNEQTYSFAGYANTVVGALFSVWLATLLSYFPTSPRPEKRFLRLQRRFFRQGRRLLSQLAADRPAPGALARWRLAGYRNDLQGIPTQLAALADQIDYRLLPGTRAEEVRTLVTALLTLGLRIRDLLEAREEAEPDPRLERVNAELRSWRELAQDQLGRWVEDPAAAVAPVADMRERIGARVVRMEAGLDEAREREESGPAADFEPFYRYLGGFRGLAEAGVGYAELASRVSWPVWREARF